MKYLVIGILLLCSSCRMIITNVRAEGDVLVEQLQEAGQEGGSGELRGNKLDIPLIK